jgi:hypothetical protein
MISDLNRFSAAMRQKPLTFLPQRVIFCNVEMPQSGVIRKTGGGMTPEATPQGGRQ